MLMSFFSSLSQKATLIIITAVIFLFCTFLAYFKGSADAKEACTNRYEAQIAQEQLVRSNTVASKLAEIRERNSKLREEYAKINRQISEGVFNKTEIVYHTVEKSVEKPVYVQGSCAISYADVARVFDTVAAAAGDN